MHSNKPPCIVATAAPPELKYVEDDPCFDDDNADNNSKSNGCAMENETVTVKTEDIDSDTDTVCLDVNFNADIDLEIEVATEEVYDINVNNIDTNKSYLSSVVLGADTVTSSVANETCVEGNDTKGLSSANECQTETVPEGRPEEKSVAAALDKKSNVATPKENTFVEKSKAKPLATTAEEQSTATTPEENLTVVAVEQKSAASTMSSNTEVKCNENQPPPPKCQMRKARSKSVTSRCFCAVEEKSTTSRTTHSNVKRSENKSKCEEKACSKSVTSRRNTVAAIDKSSFPLAAEETNSEKTLVPQKCQPRKARSKSVTSRSTTVDAGDESVITTSSSIGENRPSQIFQGRKARSKSVDTRYFLQTPIRITRSKSCQFGLYDGLPSDYKETTPRKRRKSFCAGTKRKANEEDKTPNVTKTLEQSLIEKARASVSCISDPRQKPFFEKIMDLLDTEMQKLSNKDTAGKTFADKSKKDAKSAVEQTKPKPSEKSSITHKSSSAHSESNLKKDTDTEKTTNISKIYKRRASTSVSKHANETEPLKAATDQKSMKHKDDEPKKRRKTLDEENNKKLKLQELEKPSNSAFTNPKKSMDQKSLVKFGDFKKTHKFNLDEKKSLKNKEIFQKISSDEMEEPTSDPEEKIHKSSLNKKELTSNSKEKLQKSLDKKDNAQKENLQKVALDKKDISSNHKEKVAKSLLNQNQKQNVQKSSLDKKELSSNQKENVQRLPLEKKKTPSHHKENVQKKALSGKKELSSNQKVIVQKIPYDKKDMIINHKSLSDKIESSNHKENVQKLPSDKKQMPCNNNKQNLQKSLDRKEVFSNQNENLQKSSDETQLSPNHKMMFKKLFGEDKHQDRPKNKRKHESEPGKKKRRETENPAKEQQLKKSSSKADITTAYNELVQELLKVDDTEQSSITLHAVDDDDMETTVLVNENKCLPIRIASVGTLIECQDFSALPMTDFIPNMVNAIESFQQHEETFIVVQATQPRQELSHKATQENRIGTNAEGCFDKLSKALDTAVANAEANKNGSGDAHQAFTKALEDAITEAQNNIKRSNSNGATDVQEDPSQMQQKVSTNHSKPQVYIPHLVPKAINVNPSYNTRESKTCPNILRKNTHLQKPNTSHAFIPKPLDLTMTNSRLVQNKTTALNLLQNNTKKPVTETNDQSAINTSVSTEAADSLHKERTNPSTNCTTQVSNTAAMPKRPVKTRKQNKPQMSQSESKDEESKDDMVHNIVKNVICLKKVHDDYYTVKTSENPAQSTNKSRKRDSAGQSTVNDNILKHLLVDNEKTFREEKEKQKQSEINHCAQAEMQPKLPNAANEPAGNARQNPTTNEQKNQHVLHAPTASANESLRPPKVPRIYMPPESQIANMSKRLTCQTNLETQIQVQTNAPVDPGSSASQQNGNVQTAPEVGVLNSPSVQQQMYRIITVVQFVGRITHPIALVVIQISNFDVVHRNFKTFLKPSDAKESLKPFQNYFMSEVRKVSQRIAKSLEGVQGLAHFEVKQLTELLNKELQVHYKLNVMESRLLKSIVLAFTEVYEVTKVEFWKMFYLCIKERVIANEKEKRRRMEQQQRDAMQLKNSTLPVESKFLFSYFYVYVNFVNYLSFL